MTDLSSAIAAAWEARESLNPSSTGAHRDAVEATLAGLDAGELRAAEKIDGAW
jgi:2,3,4,5-tetrahydropyridine-2-carboxylate N-succinyltransferase